MNLLLDTDVFICFLRGDRRVRPIFSLRDRFYYSYITKKELLKKPGLGTQERETILKLLGRMRQVSVDEAIASMAESLLKKYRAKGLKVADALIASTALKIDAVLVTYNQKDFRIIEGLTLFPVEKIKK